MVMFFEDKQKEILKLEKELRVKSNRIMQLIEKLKGILYVFRICLSNKQHIVNLILQCLMKFKL